MDNSEFKAIDIRQPIIFILGAGASKPYGFPLGNELKSMLINNLSKNDVKKMISEHGFENSLINEFQESLEGTYHLTIDVFLEKKKNFRDIASFVIAYTLLPLEIHNQLFPNRDWYKHIYNFLCFEEEKPYCKNIKFVTLNYDRSLEHFLIKNIRYNCSETRIDCAISKLKDIDIIHAHGSLGNYPEIPYGANPVNKEILRRAANGIKIVSDKLEDSDDFKKAKQAIRFAHNIIFIGFGYDPTTLAKLFDSNYDNFKNLLGINEPKTKYILGTNYMLDEDRIKFVDKYFNKEILLTHMPADNFLQFILPIK